MQTFSTFLVSTLKQTLFVYFSGNTDLESKQKSLCRFCIADKRWRMMAGELLKRKRKFIFK